MVLGALGLGDLTLDRMMDGRGGGWGWAGSCFLQSSSHASFLSSLSLPDLHTVVILVHFRREIEGRDRTVRILKTKQKLTAVS